MDELMKIYETINKLKHQEREGWVRMGVPGNKDTIGSHTFGATLLGWILSKRENVDCEKVIKMLLVHDLIMAHIPDHTPAEKEYLTKRDIENSAITKLIKTIPSDLKKEFEELFIEYQDEESEEYKIARESDKLDTLFQSLFYSKKLGRDELSSFLGTYREKFKSDSGKNILSELEKVKF